MYFGKIEEEKIETPEQFFKCLQIALMLSADENRVDLATLIINIATCSTYGTNEIKIICSYAAYCDYPYDYAIGAINAPRDFFAHASAERIRDFHVALALAVGDARCIHDSRANIKRWCDNALKLGVKECDTDDRICDMAGGNRTKFDYSVLDKQ